MTATPLFSVLLPTHNRPDTLALAVRSVLAQTMEDWELLIVGDGCTDNTADVAEGFADPRIRWFDLPKAPGFGYANRNIALREARGELVAFLGHDNLFLPDHLELMAAPFARPVVKIAYARPLFIRDDGVMAPFFVSLLISPVLHEFMNRRNMIPATCFVHRRDVFGKVGYWPEDEERSGDWTLWKRIVSGYGAKSVRLVPTVTNLHFRADWRAEKGWGPAPLRYLFAMRDAGRYWPAGLDLELPGDGSPQEQVWQIMQVDPKAFVKQLRQGVGLLHDHLAWNAGLDPAFP